MLERDARKDSEFFDQDVKTNMRGSINLLYELFHHTRTRFQNILLDQGRGCSVLEIGCGTGAISNTLAPVSKNVVGIDVSKESLNIARTGAESAGIFNIEYRVMDAESLDFADNSFDIVCGCAILHHLNLDRAISESIRVLRPGGTAVFIEPLGHNPLINLFRKLTPNLRVEDEHPLRRHEVQQIAAAFQQSQTEYYYFLALAGAPFKKFSFAKSLINLLVKVDALLFRIFPFFQSFAWQTVIILKDPKR